jgi:hypothetical protein
VFLGGCLAGPFLGGKSGSSGSRGLASAIGSFDLVVDQLETRRFNDGFEFLLTTWQPPESVNIRDEECGFGCVGD